ncbi:MAG: aminodeoxychorismate synthase component I, partial [Actinomycetota bacterium]|nr:aminodeoxychorismate synthase component I [Actinomycetota bacterium]
MEPFRLVTHPLDGDVPPSRGALLVCGDRAPFALVGRWAGSRAIVGSEPVRPAGEEGAPGGGPEGAAHGAVGGGWFGVLGFQLGRGFERVGDPPPRPTPQPSSLRQFHDHVLRCDSEGRWWFEALWTEERADELECRRDELAQRVARGAGEPRPVRTARWRSTPGPEGHAAAVEACRRRIAAGDLFQANLTVRLDSRLDGRPVDVFVKGVEALRPDRAAFFQDGDRAVASLSPELFLERKGRRVRSAPIKGTASDPEALTASAKDRAENVMIVDLVRNDLGRVCEPGSIRVEALAEPRPHTGVWHLVSEVAGTLRPDATDADLLRATFPPGSVTGAPKVAALDVIHELESTGREAYCGAIGFQSPLAGLELNVAIRTFEVDGDRIWLGAGGGVVADSDPGAEAREAAAKARPLLAAIGATLAEPRTRPRDAPAPLRLHPKPVPRPDPALGVFETIRARHGEPRRLDDHLARLARSVEVLFGEAVRLGDATRLVEEAAARVGDGRVRVDVRPGGEISVEAEPVKERAPAGLRPVCVPGGLGPHKWSDRRLVDALGKAAGEAIPLLTDLDGVVLEAAWANVVIVEGDALITPPDDGRILPGVGRAALAATEDEV